MIPPLVDLGYAILTRSSGPEHFMNLSQLDRDTSQYADIVHFPKNGEPGWLFSAKPGYIATDTELKAYLGTYRIGVLVAADGAKPASKSIDINYNSHWNSVEPYDA
jgi:hypothetical protein